MINFNNIFMSRYATNKTCPLLTKYGLQQYISVKIVSHPYVHHSDCVVYRVAYISVYIELHIFCNQM
jgi:hypothetical protein